LNLVESSAPLRSAESIRHELRVAAEVNNLAVQLISRKATEEREDKKKNSDFRRRISTSSLIELHDNLLATKAKIDERERILTRE
jgi:hypothetical protein